jgi:hypothetical protein
MKIFFKNCFYYCISDELRPLEEIDESQILPTIHPNSVLPYHPVDPDYEEYYEDELDTQKFSPTKPYVAEMTTKKAPLHSSVIFPLFVHWL